MFEICIVLTCLKCPTIDMTLCQGISFIKYTTKNIALHFLIHNGNLRVHVRYRDYIFCTLNGNIILRYTTHLVRMLHTKSLSLISFEKVSKKTLTLWVIHLKNVSYPSYLPKLRTTNFAKLISKISFTTILTVCFMVKANFTFFCSWQVNAFN